RSRMVTLRERHRADHGHEADALSSPHYGRGIAAPTRSAATGKATGKAAGKTAGKAAGEAACKRGGEPPPPTRQSPWEKAREKGENDWPDDDLGRGWWRRNRRLRQQPRLEVGHRLLKRHIGQDRKSVHELLLLSEQSAKQRLQRRRKQRSQRLQMIQVRLESR